MKKRMARFLAVGAVVLGCTASTERTSIPATQSATIEQSAQRKHALAGTWAGKRVEARINDDATGYWCYRTANKSMHSGTLESAYVGEKVISMKYRGRIMSLRPARGKRDEALLSNWDPALGTVLGSTVTIRMRRTQRVRCLERFSHEGDEAPTVERSADDAPIIGAWAGTWVTSINHVGLLIERIDRRGRVHGRYCTRRIYRDHGVTGLWDIDPSGGFRGRATEDGREVTVDIPSRMVKNQIVFTVNEHDEVEMVHKKHAGQPKEKRTKAWMHRGLEREGCIQRTTPKPAKNAPLLSEETDRSGRQVEVRQRTFERRAAIGLNSMRVG